MSDVLKELLPCPFCGSDDIHTTSGRGTGFRQYHCNSCHAKGPVVDAVYDGDKSWNTRAQSDLTAQLTPPKDAGENEFIRKYGDGNPPDFVTSCPEYEGSARELEQSVEFFDRQSTLWNPHIKPLIQAGKEKLEAIRSKLGGG